MDAERPDWVVVQGDTATAMAGALAAYYRKIPVAMSRRACAAATSTIPGPRRSTARSSARSPRCTARRPRPRPTALRRENVDPATVHVTGNTVIDALHWITARIAARAGAGRGPRRARARASPASGSSASPATGARTSARAWQAIAAAIRRLAARDRRGGDLPGPPQPQRARGDERASSPGSTTSR